MQLRRGVMLVEIDDLIFDTGPNTFARDIGAAASIL